MEIAQVVAAVTPKLEPPTSTEYTWWQTWRFMVVGAVKALAWSSAPVAAFIYMYYWEEPFPWRKGLAIAAAVWGPTLAKYAMSHWHLLKAPPLLDTPSEWNPDNKPKWADGFKG